MRLGRGEALSDILASSSQVAEGVATAGVVVGLGRTYRVSLPVLTAVAQVGGCSWVDIRLPQDLAGGANVRLLWWVQVLDGALSPAQAVYEIMNLPQIDES